MTPQGNDCNKLKVHEMKEILVIAYFWTRTKLTEGLHSHLFSQYAFLGTYTYHIGDFFVWVYCGRTYSEITKKKGEAQTKQSEETCVAQLNTRRTYRQIFRLVS